MNFQSIGNDGQYPGRYRHDFFVDLLSADGRSGREIARAAGISHTLFYEVCEGQCSKIETLGRIVDAFKTKFPSITLKQFFDYELPKDRFLRSVVRGGATAGR